MVRLPWRFCRFSKKESFRESDTAKRRNLRFVCAWKTSKRTPKTVFIIYFNKSSSTPSQLLSSRR